MRSTQHNHYNHSHHNNPRDSNITLGGGRLSLHSMSTDDHSGGHILKVSSEDWHEPWHRVDNSTENDEGGALSLSFHSTSIDESGGMASFFEKNALQFSGGIGGGGVTTNSKLRSGNLSGQNNLGEYNNNNRFNDKQGNSTTKITTETTQQYTK